jgi:formiminotetrahydrofolate cyclodeaminase
MVQLTTEITMGKKKETIQDIMDRIQEDIETLRDKVEVLENHDCDSDEDFDSDEDIEDDEE